MCRLLSIQYCSDFAHNHLVLLLLFEISFVHRCFFAHPSHHHFLQRRNDRGAISKWRCSRNRLFRSVFRALVRMKTCLHTCIKEDPERARILPLSHAYLSKGREDARQRRNDRGAISKLQSWVRRQTRHPKRPRGKLSCHLETMPIDTKDTEVVDSAGMTEGPRILLVMQTSVGIGTPTPTAG